MVDNVSAFEKAFAARTKELRAAWGTREQLVVALRMAMHNIEKYETKRCMPHRYIPQFIAIVKGDIAYLMTGTRQSVTAAPSAPPSKKGQRHSNAAKTRAVSKR